MVFLQGNGSFKPTEEVMEAWKATKEIAESLCAKVIVFQCPPSFKSSHESKKNLKQFFKKIDRGDFTLVWEPRGDWNSKEIESLCKELDLIHCVDPFKNKPLYGDIRYFRLHGKTGYRYSFTDEDLRQLKEWSMEMPTYCMFNNISMSEDAKRFIKLIAI